MRLKDRGIERVLIITGLAATESFSRVAAVELAPHGRTSYRRAAIATTAKITLFPCGSASSADS